MIASASSPLLSIRGLSKSFGGTSALSDVSLDVFPGEVHGLLGENGSGKSTLIKTLAGFHAPEAGWLEIRGRNIQLPLAPGQFRSLGIEFVHQDLALIPTLTVLENLLAGRFASMPGLRPIAWRTERRMAEATLARYGVYLDVMEKVRELRPVHQALVAVIRAVEAISARLPEGGHAQGVLCLDEPTAFLPRDEVDHLFALVRRITSTGASVIFVSHDLDEVRRITDRVTVLRNGMNVGTVETAATSVQQLARMIVGRDLETMGPVDSQTMSGQVVLSVDQLCTDVLDHVSIALRAGEILGVTGLIGSGFEELPYALFGATRAWSGEAAVFGEPVGMTAMTPVRAMSRGIALVPGDRQRDGGIATLTLSENMMQLALREYFRHGVLNRSRLKRDARALMDIYDIRPRQPEMPYGSYSGGNQQKALMAKWLERKPRVLLLHEPTQGVDVGARLTILQLVRDAAANGAAVVCASADYEQLAMVCQRVAVFAHGRVFAELTGPEITKEYIAEQCLISTSAAPAQQAIDPARQ